MIIAFDMDGTLSHDDKTVSDFTLDTLRKLKQLGHILVPCTGRDITSSSDWMLDNSLCSFGIYGSGSYVFDTKNKKKIFYHPLPNQEITKVYELVRKYDVDLDLFVDGCVYSDANTIDRLEYFLPNQSQDFVNTIRKYRKVVENPYMFVEENREIERISIFCAHNSEKLELMELLKAFDVEVSSSLRDNIEITAKGVNKASGLIELCSHLNEEYKNVMMFGDSSNDIEALKYAGYAVAMKNADKEVFFASNYITEKSNNDDGVAHFLNDFFKLIQE